MKRYSYSIRWKSIETHTRGEWQSGGTQRECQERVDALNAKYSGVVKHWVVVTKNSNGERHEVRPIE